MTEVSDVITLRGLSAVGQHGVFDFERSGAQVFSADLTLHIDSRLAAQTDDVQYTVDYGEVADAAVAVLTGPPVYLLETLAHNLAAMALENPLVLAVDVTIHKPMAPVRHQFTDVSVTISRTRNTLPINVEAASAETETGGASLQSSAVVLGLGSNQGDSVDILTRTVAALIELPGIEIEDVSPLVVTKPVLAPGQAPQPDYFNAVVLARTVLGPVALLEVLQSVEQQFGRTRGERWGARTLDIDIIDYGQRTEELPGLHLPHPRAAERTFVLYPWSLVDADATLPDGRKVGDLAPDAETSGDILQTRYDWLKDPEVQEDEVVAEVAEVELPAREAAAEVTQVVIRGNPVNLVDMDEDPLFQRLLRKELKTAGAAAADSAEVAAQEPARPAQPSLPRRADRHRHAGPHLEPELPDWRFLGAAQTVRIIDSADGEFADAAEAPLETPHDGIGRRRVYRPTPTGMIPLPRPKGSPSEGDA